MVREPCVVTFCVLTGFSALVLLRLLVNSDTLEFDCFRFTEITESFLPALRYLG